jgi:hypothetical protein
VVLVALPIQSAVDVEPHAVEQLEIREPEAAHFAPGMETGGGISAVCRAERPGAVASHHKSAI